MEIQSNIIFFQLNAVKEILVDEVNLKRYGFCHAESYLANLSLYPGRSELPFLPANTQVIMLILLLN